jgi:hypothetical protein
MRSEGSSDIGDFEDYLRRLRYRGGEIDGYGSRLHYTCDWRFDNMQAGFLKDVTRELGGVPYEKEVAFMSRNPQYYAALEDPLNVAAIRKAEADINQRDHYYIPEEQLQSLESGIKDGDILALTTKVKHLDIAHLGFAIWVDGRVHLLHASSKNKQVVISRAPLVNELKVSPSRHGVMVFRPLAKR